jgi:hypothetical protein
VPDVAMCSYNVAVVVDNGQAESFYGTSVATPLWAGFTALVNQQAARYGNGPVGFLNPALYAIGASAGYATNFHDIISGNNTNSGSPNAYFAVAGYDLCTGWGTPNGSNLINTLAPPDTLVMLPVPGFSSSGPGGGPFNVTTDSFSLTNEGAVPLSWGLQSDVPWLSVSPTNGTLNPAGTATVLVRLNAAASNLFVGDYTAHLTLTNLSNGLLHQRTFTLHVSDPLAVSPEGGFEFAGPPSGPFNVAAESCQLSNASQDSVSWTVVTNPPWLNVSPTNGVLGPNGTALVSCTLNTAAADLPQGSFSAALVFSNATFEATETVPLLFMVGQLVQNGGFETGDLTGWTLTGDTYFVSVLSEDQVVHSGAYGLVLDNLGEMGYISQTIPTIPGQLYSISLWLDSPTNAAPNGFTVSWDGSVAYNVTNLGSVGWTNLQFTLPATHAQSVLQIGFANSAFLFGLDDVSVTVAPPTVALVTPASGPVEGGTTVTISGLGFQTHAAVAFGPDAAPVAFISASNLTVIAPGSSTVGLVDVAITNADGQTAVLTNGFLYVGTPVITWTNPSAFTYGSALGAVQLDASANVLGAFSYFPAAGTVLDSGSNQLSAVFTPNDNVDYFSVTDYVAVMVTPAPLSVTASNATRPYGVSNPVFTGLIVGLQNGDNITASYTCAALPNSPAGMYPILATLTDPNGRLSNYRVSISNGTLTVLVPVPPVFNTTELSTNIVAFSWTATTGAAYQVQSSSSLTTTNWLNVGGMIVATNATASATDRITNVQRFYRVLLVPQ